MNLLIKAAAVAAALGASALSSAATFDFSYTFSDGQEINGSLNGTLNGTTIDNISDLQVSLNGIAFSGGTDSAGATALNIACRLASSRAGPNRMPTPAITRITATAARRMRKLIVSLLWIWLCAFRKPA